MFNEKLFIITSLFLACNGISKIHYESKEKTKENKVLQNIEIISNSRSYNDYHSLQINRRDKSDKITFSNHEQKYNRYRKSNTENSNQHKEKYEVQNDYDSGDSEYLFYHEGGYQSPTRETSLSSSDHSRSSTTTDNDNESIGSRHHDSMSNYSAKSSKKYSMSSKGNNKEHSESSKGSSRETYIPSHRPTTIFYPTSCSGKKCGSSKGSSKAAYSSSSKKQSKKGEYPSHEPTSKPIVQTANPTPIYPTPFITSLPTITPKPTLKPIEPTSPTPSTPTPTGCNDKGCPRPPRLDIPTSIPSTILRPPVISQEPSNFPSICIGPNCPPNSYSNIS